MPAKSSAVPSTDPLSVTMISVSAGECSMTERKHRSVITRRLKQRTEIV
jgi:hypothetical protein